MVKHAPDAAARPAIIPDAYRLLSGWCYLEHSLLRVWAGWGRHAGDWEDKLAVCYHTWLQAEITDMMRRRLAMFPGGKADQAVARGFEDLANAVLLAPDWPQATAGIHYLNTQLTDAYRGYLATTHPVHDRPTLELLNDALWRKDKLAAWYDDFQQRHPHTLDPAYRQRIDEHLAALGTLRTPIEPAKPHARPCGTHTDFRLPRTPGRVRDWDQAPNIMPLLEVDWSTSVEARRLFFCIGYMWEMGVAENQLTWIYYAHFMPWAFVYAEARHMWDESRHGHSGMSRLEDFGLAMGDIGYSSYGVSDTGTIEPMTPRDVYEAFYHVTQIAETGYFETKRYCFEDFRLGHDDGSAEMMQYDIIDETSHVQYGRDWLEKIAAHADVHEDYRKRGAHDRTESQQASDQRARQLRAVAAGKLKPDDMTHANLDANYNPASASDATTVLDPTARRHYDFLIQRLRGRQPLRNVADAPVRPNLPM